MTRQDSAERFVARIHDALDGYYLGALSWDDFHARACETWNDIEAAGRRDDVLAALRRLDMQRIEDGEDAEHDTCPSCGDILPVGCSCLCWQDDFEDA